MLDSICRTRSRHYAYVVPQEWLKQKVNLDVDYKILPQSNTKLTLGYEFDDIDRSNAQVGHSDTNTGTVGLSSMLGSAFMGRITGQLRRPQRRAGLLGAVAKSDHRHQRVRGWRYSVRRLLPGADDIERDQPPRRLFSGGRVLRRSAFKFENDDYHYPSTTAGTPAGTAPANLVNQVEGIKQDYNLTAGIDGNYRPTEGVNLHAYYTYEEIFYNNLGNGACSAAAETYRRLCAGSAGYFQNKYTTDVQTVGLSAEWQATDRLKLTGELHLRLRLRHVRRVQWSLCGRAEPELSKRDQLPGRPNGHERLHGQGTYKLTENVELSLGGMYSMFYDKDWRDETCAVVSHRRRLCNCREGDQHPDAGLRLAQL